MDADARKLKSLNDALKRNIEQGKRLRQEKQIVTERLYKDMERRGLQEYDGIKISTIRPRVKAKRKKQRQKKNDAINLFTQIGIPDPENFWIEFQGTQKYKTEEEEEI